MPKTLFDKIWDAHEVAPGLLYIDLHLVHEVTSAQAFDGLRLAGRTVRRTDRTVATADHNVPTDGTPVSARIRDSLSRVQVQTLERNCEEFGVPIYSLGSEHQGIVHVIGPELGVTQPGMTIVCGDSHTATHGAFGALAFGIGTSEVEHVLATQCMVQSKPRSMRIRYHGSLGFGVTAKDLILATIGQIGRRRRGRPRGRVRRRGDRVAVDGRADDRLQHDDRGRRPCRDDRARRDDVRMGYGPTHPAGRAVGGARRVAGAAHRAGGDVRSRDRRRRRSDQSDGDLGHDAGNGRSGDRGGARARLRAGRARARVHGPSGGNADPGDQARPRVHRLVHELADRRSARRSLGDRRPQGRQRRLRDGRARLAAGQAAGRARGARRGLQARRV